MQLSGQLELTQEELEEHRRLDGNSEYSPI